MITASAENTHFATSQTTVRNLAAFMQTQAYVACGVPPATVNGYNDEIAAGFTAPTGFSASIERGAGLER